MSDRKRVPLTQVEKVRLLNQWEIDLVPQYRGFQCAGCGKKNMRRAWHIHVKDGKYWREFHLCRKCGNGYEELDVPEREPTDAELRSIARRRRKRR